MQEQLFHIAPNPNQGHFNLQLAEKSAGNLTVYSALGEKIFFNSYAQKESNLSVNLNHLPQGIYWIEWNTGMKKKAERLVLLKP